MATVIPSVPVFLCGNQFVFKSPARHHEAPHLSAATLILAHKYLYPYDHLGHTTLITSIQTCLLHLGIGRNELLYMKTI